MSSGVTLDQFSITVEVVPPEGPDAEPLLKVLEKVAHLPFDGFSIASNPVAKPRMSALALAALIQQRTGKPATLHCTTRDHNQLSIQGLLWGARALGIRSVLAATGDFVALGARSRTTTVRDLDVFALVRMAREAGLITGVVLDPCPESMGLQYEIRRLEYKIKAGAQFVVTQPVYGSVAAEELYEATRHVGIPVILGILPLRTARHARFLHQEVAGITVPEVIQKHMEEAADPVAEGLAGAQEMLSLAREWFAGACIMPAWNHHEVLFELLGED